jgi:DNA-binding XRE family transcriptional regulator
MITPQQIRGARAMLGFTQAELAKRAGISTTGLNNIESGTGDPKASTLAAIKSALEAAGVEFTNGDAPGVKLHKAGARVATIPIEDLNAENDE